jgi:hypothetical protein
MFVRCTYIFLRILKTKKSNWFGHNVGRSCFLKHVTEGKMEGRIKVAERQGRRRKQLLDDGKEKRE